LPIGAAIATAMSSTALPVTGVFAIVRGVLTLGRTPSRLRRGAARR
jgi:C4-dicarboxylate transporter